MFYVIGVLEYSNTGVYKFQKEKNIFFIFYTRITEIVSTYDTGLAFTQHYYVCRV